MAEPAIDPFANGANPFRGPIDPFADGTIPFRPQGNTSGGSGQATIDMLQAALNRAGASRSASPPSGTASSAGRSSGQATIDLLQAGLDGKLPPVSGVNPFADLPPVPIGGTGSTPANGVRGTETNFLKGAGIKLDQAGKLPMLTHIAVDSVFGAIGGGIGHLLGPEQAIAGAYVDKKLGDKVLHAVEEAGLRRIKQLRVEAVLNPDLAVALMKEAPKQPNRDAAAILALRLRQLSMAGILAKQQH